MEIKKILVPIDGSIESREALRVGVDMASKYGAMIHLVTVINFNAHQPILSLGNVDDFTEEGLQRRGMEVIDKLLGDEFKDVPMEKVVLYGNPAKEIISEQEHCKADCIVLGSRGLGTVSRFFMGSVSTEIVHNAECPVFIIR